MVFWILANTKEVSTALEVERVPNIASRKWKMFSGHLKFVGMVMVLSILATAKVSTALEVEGVIIQPCVSKMKNVFRAREVCGNGNVFFSFWAIPNKERSIHFRGSQEVHKDIFHCLRKGRRLPMTEEDSYQ